MKWGVRKNPQRAYEKSMKKLRKISVKEDAMNVKAAKAKMKSHKKEMKALRTPSLNKYNKLMTKQRKLLGKSYKFELKSAKLQKKGHKWVSAMNREFENVKITDISADDRSLGKRYALELMDRNKK